MPEKNCIDIKENNLLKIDNELLELLLQDKTTLDRMWILRKYLSDMNAIEAMSTIHKNMQHTRNNDEFLLSMNS